MPMGHSLSCQLLRFPLPRASNWKKVEDSPVNSFQWPFQVLFRAGGGGGSRQVEGMIRPHFIGALPSHHWSSHWMEKESAPLQA